MVRVVFFVGGLCLGTACGAPLRQVPPALDPSSPDAPESALPQRVPPTELPPPRPEPSPPPAASPQPLPQPMDDMPAGHHMHHLHDMTPNPPPSVGTPSGVKVKPMDHSLHGGAGGGA